MDCLFTCRFLIHHPKTVTLGATTSLQTGYYQYRDSWSFLLNHLPTWSELPAFGLRLRIILTAKVQRNFSFLYLYSICYVCLHFANSFSAVVDALKTLQEKIKRLELERKQAEKNYLQFSHEAQKHQQVASSSSASFLGPGDSARKGECKENTVLHFCGTYLRCCKHTHCHVCMFSVVCCAFDRGGHETAISRGSL